MGIKIEDEEEWKQKCPSFFEEVESSEEDFDDKDTSSDDDTDKRLDDNQDILEEAKDCDFNAITCLVPKEPEATIIVNHSDKMKKVKKKKKGEKFYTYAPGKDSFTIRYFIQAF